MFECGVSVRLDILNHPHHVYDSEDEHPDNIEKVPVEANNEQFSCSNRIDASACNLIEHRDHP